MKKEETKKCLEMCFLAKHIFTVYICDKGVGEGGGGRGHEPPPPTFKSGGGHKWVCAPPLLGRANVLISLFAHILWLKHIFSKFSWLASLANFNKSIFSKLC